MIISIKNDGDNITLGNCGDSESVFVSGKMLTALAVTMRVQVYARKSKKLICRNNVFYNGRGNGAERTIVNIPDRLIRKKNSNEQR